MELGKEKLKEGTKFYCEGKNIHKYLFCDDLCCQTEKLKAIIYYNITTVTIWTKKTLFNAREIIYGHAIESNSS